MIATDERNFLHKLFLKFIKNEVSPIKHNQNKTVAYNYFTLYYYELCIKISITAFVCLRKSRVFFVLKLQ